MVANSQNAAHADSVMFAKVISFIRALNHKLLTPISTISNELYCLENSENVDEITCAKNQISKLLDILTALEPHGTPPTNYDPKTAFSEIFPEASQDLVQLVPSFGFNNQTHALFVTLLKDALSVLVVPPTLTATNLNSFTVAISNESGKATSSLGALPDIFLEANSPSAWLLEILLTSHSIKIQTSPIEEGKLSVTISK